MSPPDKPPVASPLLTRKEAADYLRISIATFERLHIEGFRIGGRRVFYTKEMLDAWIDARTPKAALEFRRERLRTAALAASSPEGARAGAGERRARDILMPQLSATARATADKLERRARERSEREAGVPEDAKGAVPSRTKPR